MAQATRLAYPLLLILLACLVPSAAASHNRFHHMSGQYGFIFDRIISDNCSAQYDSYRNGSVPEAQWNESIRWLGGSLATAYVAPLINCILENAPEYTKSGMAAASIVLGLTPMILTTLGSSVEETSILAVVGRRPFLALLLGAGSPAVEPLRIFEYRPLLGALETHPPQLRLRLYSFSVEVIIYVAEHILCFAAIANIATLSYQLGTTSVVIFASEYTWLVLAWAFLGAVPHLLATLALKSLVQVDTQKGQHTSFSLRAWIMPWERKFNEAERPRVTIKVYPTGIFYTLISGFLSLFITAHIVFGTMLFSSTIFVSIRDVMPIIFRFVASVITCRVILKFEVARLRRLAHEPKQYSIVTLGDEEEEEEHAPNMRRELPFGYLLQPRSKSGGKLSAVSKEVVPEPPYNS